MPAVNFDPVARPYRWLEYLSFGPSLALCRNAQLAHLTQAQNALVLGDGDGRFLARLLSVNATLTADVVDSSQAMLDLLENRARRAGVSTPERIRLHHSDALEWHATRSYDLIVSHFFLDCFFPQQLEQLLDRVLPHAVPGALWVISEFAIPPNRVAAYVARRIIALLYRAFGVLTGLRVRQLPDYEAALLLRGLIPGHDRRYLGGLLHSKLWFLPNTPLQK